LFELHTSAFRIYKQFLENVLSIICGERVLALKVDHTGLEHLVLEPKFVGHAGFPLTRFSIGLIVFNKPLNEPELFLRANPSLLVGVSLNHGPDELIDMADQEVARFELGEGNREPLKFLEDFGGNLIRVDVGPAGDELKPLHDGELGVSIEFWLEQLPLDNVLLHGDVLLVVVHCHLLVAQEWDILIRLHH
jgi:hypothetical protein